MATEVRLPKIGISMTEAVLSEWLARDGDRVEAGSPLYTMEMDKSANEVEAPASGILRVVAVEGETYGVGDLLATIE